MTNMVILQETNGRWFGHAVEGKSTIKIAGPTFTGFATKKAAEDTARALGYRPVDQES